MERFYEKYQSYNEQIIGLSFVRQPFSDDLMGWAGLADEDALIKAFEAFMVIAQEVFNWNDYYEARTTAEMAFREFYKKQRYPKENLEAATNGFIVSFFNQVIDESQHIWEEENPGEEMPEPAGDDIDNLYLARVFSIIHQVTDKKADAKFCDSIGVSYDYDQLHMCCWFSVQVTRGSGRYTRSKPNFSARATYNRLLNPWSLLWIGVVIGADRDALRAAAKEMADEKALRGKCAVVRRHVPFEAILKGFDALMAEEVES